MRKLVALLSLWIALSATAAELWRWKDAEGVMHYSDQPVQGAERIDVQAQRLTGTVEAKPQAAAPQSAPAPVSYARCAVVAPMNDEVFNAVSEVSARVDVEPALQAGHRLQVFLNGSAFPDWPANQFAYTLTSLYRGTYSLNVRVIDASGRALCTGSVIKFHLRQPSLLAPGRRPAGR